MARVHHTHLDKGASYVLDANEADDTYVREWLDRMEIPANIITIPRTYLRDDVGFIEFYSIQDAWEVAKLKGWRFVDIWRLGQLWTKLEGTWANVGPPQYTIRVSMPDPSLHLLKDILKSNTAHEVSVLVHYRHYQINFAHEDDYVWARMALA